MILKIHPFSCESSFLGRIGWFLVKKKNLNFSCRIITYSYERRMNHGSTGDSWKSSILPRFVWFGLIRLNLEKKDVFTRIVFSQRYVRSGRFSVVMKPSNKAHHPYMTCCFTCCLFHSLMKYFMKQLIEYNMVVYF